MIKRIALAALATALLTSCANNEEKKTTLAVVGKAAGGEYWLAVKHGAEKKAAELNVKLLYMGPATEVDIAGQVNMVEDLIQRKVDGIAISPTDSKALSPVVKKAVDAGIKVVTIDSDTTEKDRLCYIGTNNVQAGEVAGKEMLKLTGGKKAKVATITGVIGAQNLQERIEGFKKAVGDELTLLNVQPDNGNKDKAMSIAENTMTANPDIAAFFSTTAIGGPAVAQALASANKSGQIKVISFDTTPTLIKQLKAGQVQVLIAQQPENMGAVGLESLLKAIKGEKLPPVIDTGVVAVTKDNVAQFEK
jgi:ribose transport system substrate-binding protein